MTNSLSKILTGRAFVAGDAQGEILATDTELSFWGGVDPATGEVIDRHHPLSGQLLEGKNLGSSGRSWFLLGQRRHPPDACEWQRACRYFGLPP